MRIFSKLKSGSRNLTTYKVGLLQAKAYRALKQHTGKVLGVYSISTIEWALLGLLYTNSNGLRMNVLAMELGVEAPFVTATLVKLKKRDMLVTIEDPTDSRAKIVKLTKDGREFVKETEVVVRKEMRPLVKDIPLSDLLSYVSVLEEIEINFKNLK